MMTTWFEPAFASVRPMPGSANAPEIEEIKSQL